MPGLTIVTNSLRVADLFAGNRGPDGASVVVTGGMRATSDALVGPVADLTIGSLHFDTLFLGCTGIDAEVGLTTPNLAEAETNRSLIKVARRVVVLADHTKWGVVSLASFATLDEVNVLVTDSCCRPTRRRSSPPRWARFSYRAARPVGGVRGDGCPPAA